MAAEATALAAEGRRLYEARRYGEAEQRFGQALALDDANADALYGLGLIALAQADREQAWTRLTRAADADPTHTGALMALAELAEAFGDLGVARELYAEVASVKPGHQRAREAVHRLEASAPPDGSLITSAAPAAAAAPAPVAAPSPPPYPPSSRDSTVGVITAFQKGTAPFRNRMNALQSWTMRVDCRNGPSAGRLVDVELRGHTIEGSPPAVGDWLELPRYDGGTIRRGVVRNLTTNGEIRVKFHPLISLFWN